MSCATTDALGLASSLRCWHVGAMATVKLASPHDVNRLRGTVKLIDVREPHEYTGELGHVPEAELVPLATVSTAAAAWDKSAPIVCICRSGARSGRAAEALVALGFADVTNMTGGMIAWNAEGLPKA